MIVPIYLLSLSLPKKLFQSKKGCGGLECLLQYICNHFDLWLRVVKRWGHKEKILNPLFDPCTLCNKLWYKSITSRKEQQMRPSKSITLRIFRVQNGNQSNCCFHLLFNPGTETTKTRFWLLEVSNNPYLND